jgi:threonyl-tRNA synthetase
MPKKFNCAYVGEDNKLHLPVMIHRAIFGSVERFMAILIEHFAGEFPLWLSPVQAKIIPISESHVNYANEVKSQMQAAGIRVEVDYRSEKMGLKIREAETQKIPYMFVIGDKEMENQSLALRKRKEGNIGVMSVQEIIERFINEINVSK